jgi:hypothetical protein
MKKAAQLLILSGMLIFAALSDAGASYTSCGAMPPCNFVYDDCVDYDGNWSAEFGYYCVDSNNQVHEFYSYSCLGRGVFQQGTCYN